MTFPIDRTHPPLRVDLPTGETLRPWATTDVDAAFAALRASLPELRPYMPWAHAELTREGQYRVTAGFLADYWSGRQLVFGVFSPDGAVLGGVGLHPRATLNPKSLEVGYWCVSEHAGRGVTTRAVRALVVLAFEALGCDCLHLTHEPTNVGSQRVAEKCGFALEGLVRGIVAAPTAEQLAGGLVCGERHALRALTATDYATLPWVPALRDTLRCTDALGTSRLLAPTER